MAISITWVLLFCFACVFTEEVSPNPLSIYMIKNRNDLKDAAEIVVFETYGQNWTAGFEKKWDGENKIKAIVQNIKPASYWVREDGWKLYTLLKWGKYFFIDENEEIPDVFNTSINYTNVMLTPYLEAFVEDFQGVGFHANISHYRHHIATNKVIENAWRKHHAWKNKTAHANATVNSSCNTNGTKHQLLIIDVRIQKQNDKAVTLAAVEFWIIPPTWKGILTPEQEKSEAERLAKEAEKKVKTFPEEYDAWLYRQAHKGEL